MGTSALNIDRQVSAPCKTVRCDSQPALTSYEGAPIWRSIQTFFPSEWRIPDGQMPREETFSWHGCSVHVDRYCNPNASVRLILHHGLGTNARLMTMIAGHALSKLGYDVASPDMPYVGATNAPNDRFTYNDWIKLSSDYINRGLGNDNRPVVLFGFSVGGMLSYHVSCINHRVAGVSGTCFIDLSDREVRRAISATPNWNFFKELLGGFLCNHGVRLRVPLTTFANRKTISNNTALNHMLARDPASLGGKFPLTFLDSIRRHKPTVAPENYDLSPIALIQAEHDYNIPPVTNFRFLDKIAGRKQLSVLPSAGHIPLNADALDKLVRDVDSFARSCC